MGGKEPLLIEEVYSRVLDEDSKGKYANTDWFSESMKNGATITHHNISVNGDNETARYFVLLGYLDQSGIADKFPFKRCNLRPNLNISLGMGFKLRLDLGVCQGRYNLGYFSVANQSRNDPVSSTQRMMPIAPTTYKDIPTTASISSNTKFSPVASNNQTGYNNSVMSALTTTVTLSWNVPLAKGSNLKLKASYDKDYTTSRFWAEVVELNGYDPLTEKYGVATCDHGINKDDVAQLRNIPTQASRLTPQPPINYHRILDKHDISGLLLYEQSSYETESFGVGVQGFDLTSLHELSLGEDIMGKEKRKTINGGSYIFNQAGLVGRANYACNGRYLPELAARYDGSVRFLKESR